MKFLQPLILPGFIMSCNSNFTTNQVKKQGCVCHASEDMKDREGMDFEQGYHE